MAHPNLSFIIHHSSFIILLVALAGCGGTNAEPGGEVLVFAAASTADAIDEVKRQFEQESSCRVLTSYAGSSTLAQQIVQGAGADIFLSADVTWVDYVAAEAMAAERRDLLGNRLVVIVPKESTLDLQKPQDLAGETVKHLALADPEAVPAGKYARQALAKLGIWDAVKKKVAAAADVRQAMAYVETGAAEAGIVYATDAAISKAVKVVSEIPPQWTEPIRYAAVLLKHGAGKPAAESFYRYLFSPAAATVFQKHGFVVPEDGKTEIADEPPERPFSDALLSAEEWTALRLSFQVAACAALAGLPLAVAVGYLLARGSFGGKWLVESLVNLPLVMPPVVVGYLLLLAFAPRGPIGSILSGWFGVEVVFTWLGAALAAMVMGFPLMVRAIRLSFQSIDPRLVLAARSLGASRTRAFFTVTLPLARRGLVAGWILAFARGLGEFGATIMVAGNIEGQTRTIPLAIFAMSSRHDGMAQAWRLVGLSVLLACGALVASEWLERRGSRDAAA